MVRFVVSLPSHHCDPNTPSYHNEIPPFSSFIFLIILSSYHPATGIMVDGSFRCLGSAQHLKAKFGSGYQVSPLI